MTKHSINLSKFSLPLRGHYFSLLWYQTLRKVYRSANHACLPNTENKTNLQVVC